MFTTIFGLGFLGALGAGVGAKFGLVDFKEEIDIPLVGNLSMEFTKEVPFKITID
jgi:hypothetical protein